MRIRAIALNTFREAVRNKIFYLLIFFGIFFAANSKFISLLTVGDPVRVMKDVGLAAIDFFSVLIVIFTGINLVFKEIDKKTVYSILSKPISRDHFILGKFLGLALTTLVALTAMAIIFFITLLIFTGQFDGRMLIHFAMLFLELLIVISISLLFSSFSTPILSSIFVISIYLIGQIMWSYNEFKYLLKDLPLARNAARFVYYLLPNLHKFNLKTAIILKAPLDSLAILSSVGYGIVYICAVLLLTLIIFRHREFQ